MAFCLARSRSSELAWEWSSIMCLANFLTSAFALLLSAIWPCFTSARFAWAAESRKKSSAWADGAESPFDGPWDCDEGYAPSFWSHPHWEARPAAIARMAIVVHVFFITKLLRLRLYQPVADPGIRTTSSDSRLPLPSGLNPRSPLPRPRYDRGLAVSDLLAPCRSNSKPVP